MNSNDYLSKYAQLFVKHKKDKGVDVTNYEIEVIELNGRQYVRLPEKVRVPFQTNVDGKAARVAVDKHKPPRIVADYKLKF